MRYVWFILLFELVSSNTTFADYVRETTSQGSPLYWGEFPVTFHIHRQGTTDILSKTETYAAIRQGFFVWGDLFCTCLKVRYGGLTDKKTLGYNPKEPEKDINIVLFQKVWDHDSNAAAVTTNIFNKETGRMLAFDIELNNKHFHFGLAGKYQDAPAIDLQHTITHEAGHVFGLDHSATPGTTMSPTALPGQTNGRNLHGEDILGICAIYPKENGCGFHGTKIKYIPRGCGCLLASPSNPDLALMLLFLSSFFFLARPRKH